MQGLMMHCGGTTATMKELGLVKMPAATETHHPIAHDLFGELGLETIDRRGLDVKSTSFGLNKDGGQMFGLIRCDAINDETGLAFGLRGSHNKSLSRALAGGERVFVCDNLVFDGDGFVVMRKHTKNAWEDLERMVDEAICRAIDPETGHRRKARMDRLKEEVCNTTKGYGILGKAVGQGVLTPTQANVAFREWTDPSHLAFVPRTEWSLYNAGTEGLKKGAVSSVIDRHTAWDDFMDWQSDRGWRHLDHLSETHRDL